MNKTGFSKGISFGRTKDDKIAGDFYVFAAKNSDVEWGLDAFNVMGSKSYTIYTGHELDLTPSDLFNQSTSKILFGIHSHKNLNIPSNHPDLDDDYSSAYKGNLKYESDTGKRNYPKNYLLYAPNDGEMRLWYFQSTPSGTVQKPTQKITIKDLGNVGTAINLKNLE